MRSVNPESASGRPDEKPRTVMISSSFRDIFGAGSMRLIVAGAGRAGSTIRKPFFFKKRRGLAYRSVWQDKKFMQATGDTFKQNAYAPQRLHGLNVDGEG